MTAAVTTAVTTAVMEALTDARSTVPATCISDEGPIADV